MMSSNGDDKNKQAPVEVIDWNGLTRYTQLLSQGDETKVKICMIDEEQEEIRLQTKEDFDLNVQCAREEGCSVLKLVVYLNGQFLFHGLYQIEKAPERVFFPAEKLQLLIDNALAEKWYIPVKQDEALGVCLTAAIRLAQERKLDASADGQQFIEKVLPEAFRKLHNTISVNSWPREIQYGIFEMTELLVDLVGTRVRYPPVPSTLLNILAMVFDTNTAFSQKHRGESLPTRRTYKLIDDGFLRTDLEKEAFGWLQSPLQRFIAQSGLKYVRLQFEHIDSVNSSKAAMEYNALFKLFAKCHLCINAPRYRLMFARPIQQATQYFQRQIPSEEINELNKTLTEICDVYDIKDEVDQSLASAFNPTLSDVSPRPAEQTPLLELPNIGQRKSKSHDSYEALTDNLRLMTMSTHDLEPKNVKKQRTDEQTAGPLFTRHHVMDCIDELLTLSDKRTPKRKHRRDQQRSTLTSINQVTSAKKELKRSNTTAVSSIQTYDRSNPEDVLRYFAPMKLKVATLYDDLQTAMCHGKLREVLKIEEKLKLLHPFSARFIVDENTPDGTIMQPAQAFRKAWVLLNDGSLPWDSQDIQLVNLADGIRVVQAPTVPVTAPHDKATITVDYICPNEPGTYESKWILSYRQQTFGPMIWCSIEVRSSAKEDKTLRSIMKTSAFEEIREAFEFVDVPLPACFDLSKPFQAESKLTSNASSLRSSFILSQDDSTERASLVEHERLNIDCLLSDSDSLSSLTFSPVAPEADPTPLIELAPSADPPTLANTHEENTTMTMTVTDEDAAAQINPPMDFVDTVVNNFFSVAKQAGSTAKAIFNTLQAFDEPVTPPVQNERPALINTFFSDQSSNSSFFDPIRQTSSSSSSSVSSMDPMKTLIEMGFANRAKNQRLLRENGNDLAKVIELLTLDTIEDPDCVPFEYHVSITDDVEE